MDREFGRDHHAEQSDVITWGRSQGGHTALWAGQMMETYQQAAPNPDSATLTLAGVAAEAPAANLVAQPELQDGVSYGDGVADWEVHDPSSCSACPSPRSSCR